MIESILRRSGQSVVGVWWRERILGILKISPSFSCIPLPRARALDLQKGPGKYEQAKLIFAD